MAVQQVTRAEARNILAMMYRQSVTNINNVIVDFNEDGMFVVLRAGQGEVFRTLSLKQCLNYLFGEQND